MQCSNCGRKLLPGVKFCAGCGSPVAEPVAETTSAPERSEIPIMPEVPTIPKKGKGKLIAVITILLAMIGLLVFGYFIYKEFKGVWTKTILIKAISAGSAFSVLTIALIIVLVTKKDKKSKAKSASGGTYSGKTETLSVSEPSAAPAAPVYEAPAPATPAAPVYEAPAPATPAAPVYEAPAPAAPAVPVYEAPAPAAPVVPIYETPATATVYVEPIKEDVSAVKEDVSAVAYAPAPKSDLDVYNSVDDFEALNAPFAPIEDKAAVSYPTNPTPEGRKTVSDGWFSTAGDL